ncbi:MAG TPA: NUDIX hydrolase [Pirellulaceae bacterium]|nr:NUDIX hydrolase [Pirellulaceae bacterium]
MNDDLASARHDPPSDRSAAPLAPVGARRHGPWTILTRTEAYRDPWVRVERDDVIRPDGLPGSYCVIHLKAGVTVIAVDDRGRVHLTREFHYGVGRVTVEGASGGIDAGESPDEAARRELREELGLEARTWVDLGSVDPFTANVVSPTRLYLALGLTEVEAAPEGTERIERVTMPLFQAVEEVLASRITHAPSCLAILRGALHLGIGLRRIGPDGGSE